MNKTRVILFFFFILCPLYFYAENVSADEAKAKAEDFFQGKRVEPVLTEKVVLNSKKRTASTSRNGSPYYIYNVEGGGFVIISGESLMPDIIAYSFSSSLDVENLPGAFLDYLVDYSMIVEMVNEGKYEYEGRRKISPNPYPVVEPLCRTKWGQDDPYNKLCPKIGEETCPVGCVATAMSQIMYYYSWPEVGKGEKSYASGVDGIGMLSSDFSAHKYDWKSMLLTTSENAGNDKAASAVSRLCFDCGVGVKMQYGLEGSGSNEDNAIEALYSHFGYKASSLRLEYRLCYATNEEWEALMRSELDAKRPIMYSGVNSSETGAHEFILDGYDSNGFFHVNWGWNGSFDGYFLLLDLSPLRNYNYSKYNAAIIGIEPDYDGQDCNRPQARMYMIGYPTITTNSVNLGKMFVFRCRYICNYSVNTSKWYIGAGLFNEDGEMLDVINVRPAGNKEQIGAGAVIDEYDVSCVIKNTVPNGNYTIRAVFREDGYDEWILPHMERGAHLNAISVSVQKGVASFKKVSTNVEAPNVSARQLVRTEYYDLQGRRVMTPSAGSLYIYKVYYSDQSSTSKVVLAK